MKIRTTAAPGARAAREATSSRWLLSSLVAGLVVLMSLAAPLSVAGGDAPSEKQLRFGADMARRGLWKEALFRFQQADRLDPGNARILNNIAVSYEALGLFDEALEAYQKALRVGAEDKELKTNYAQFAEFYQSFRPKQETGEGAREAADGTEAAEQPSEETSP